MLCRYLTTIKTTAGRAPPNTVQLISRCRKQFLVWMVWSFSKAIKFVAEPCSPNCGPVPFTVLKNFFVWMLCSHLKLFKFMTGPCSPTSPVTAQLISRRWKVFRFMQIVNNVQMKSGSCSPKHGPAHFTVLKTIFVWMVLSFSKTLDFMAGPCYPKHGPVRFTVLKNLFVWCYADCQQRSIEQLVVLPQTRFSSFHGVKAFSRLDDMKLFKYHQNYGWAVLPQTRPSFFHGVKHLFLSGCYAAIQNHSSLWLGRAPQHPLSRPSSFCGVEESFRCDVSQIVNNVQINGRRAPPNTIQLVSRCQTIFSFRWYETFQKHSKSWLGRAPPNTAQFLSRCWRTFSSGCYAAIEKLLSLWFGCNPQHFLPRLSSFRSVEQFFRSDVMQTFNNVQLNAWSCFLKHDPAHFTVLKQFFV